MSSSSEPPHCPRTRSDRLQAVVEHRAVRVEGEAGSVFDLASAPGIRAHDPLTPVSVEPNPSTVITSGSNAAICVFVEADNTAPPDANTSNDETS